MKRELIISLALVMIMAAFMPSQVIAAKPVPFEACGIIEGITPGTVKPAGASGRFVVIERDIEGVLEGNINGDYTFSYKANVELETQAGNLHGTLTVGNYTFNLNGKIDPLDFVYVVIGEAGYWLPKLTISGNWNLLKGAHGVGIFSAEVTFIPTPDGHVGYIIGSNFCLTGQWQE